MAENPDRKDKVHAGFASSVGDLRFVLREGCASGHGPSQRRILQRYEWSYVEAKLGWYDIHLAEEE